MTTKTSFGGRDREQEKCSNCAISPKHPAGTTASWRQLKNIHAFSRPRLRFAQFEMWRRVSRERESIEKEHAGLLLPPAPTSGSSMITRVYTAAINRSRSTTAQQRGLTDKMPSERTQNGCIMSFGSFLKKFL